MAVRVEGQAELQAGPADGRRAGKTREALHAAGTEVQLRQRLARSLCFTGCHHSCHRGGCEYNTNCYTVHWESAGASRGDDKSKKSKMPVKEWTLIDGNKNK